MEYAFLSVPNSEYAVAALSSYCIYDFIAVIDCFLEIVSKINIFFQFLLSQQQKWK